MIVTSTFPFAPITLAAEIFEDRVWYLEACENYQKKSIRNRYDILNHQGSLSLTVPLQKGKHAQTPIKEVKIAYEEDWRGQHFKTIRSSYGKAPFYLDYEHHFEHLFQLRIDTLWEFNQEASKVISKILKKFVAPLETSNYETNIENAKDFRSKSPVPSKQLPFYNQVFEDRIPFQENLSVIDLIFSLGPESTSYLKKVKAAYI